MEIPSTAAAKIEAAVRTAGGLPSKKAAKGSQKDWSGGSVRTGAGARSNCVLERKNDNGRKYRTGSGAVGPGEREGKAGNEHGDGRKEVPSVETGAADRDRRAAAAVQDAGGGDE